MDEYSEQCGLQQSRRLLGRQESSQLARFVQISEGLDADGLIDAADADGAKSTRLDELCDSVAGVLIVASTPTEAAQRCRAKLVILTE
jgi:hypothetical protein